MILTEPVAFSVHGTPMTQGSKRGFVNPRNGRVILTEAGGARHKDWRAAIAAAASAWQEDHDQPGQVQGPVTVRLHFRLQRPLSAPKTRRTWPINARSGDADKLARSILDSLTGPLLVDDSQVVDLHVTKDWGDPPGVDVVVRSVVLTPTLPLQREVAGA